MSSSSLHLLMCINYINYRMHYLGNPFEHIKRIETSPELLDIAFSKSMKIKPPGGKMDRISRSRTHEINRINTSANVLIDRLERIVKDFPSFNVIHPFYLELAEILVDLNILKKGLGRIYGMIKHIKDVEIELVQLLSQTKLKIENKQIRKSAFGRFSSMTNQLNTQLKNLEKIRNILNPLPGFNPYIPSVVIAGVPNSGKSSFIKLTTSGKPEIASYPFTTKKLIFGHRKFGFLTVQFIDTPGLLDKPLEKRNNIELQALAALKHLSDIMIFLIDPTQQASCTVIEQVHLLTEIIEFYHVVELIIVISKSDLINSQDISMVKKIIDHQKFLKVNSEIILIHSNDQSGVKSLLKQIDIVLKNQVISNPKFKTIIEPEIAMDQLPLEDDPMWQTDSN